MFRQQDVATLLNIVFDSQNATDAGDFSLGTLFLFVMTNNMTQLSQTITASGRYVVPLVVPIGW